MTPNYDVVVVGGGAVGSAIAYFLSSAAPEQRTLVLEPDPTYARASTALAAGGIRQQFSTPENIQMSQFGYRFLEEIGETLAVDGDQPDAGLSPLPYLRLVDEGGVGQLRADHELQRRLGAGSQWLEPVDLAERFPWMSAEGIAAGVIGGGGEGLFDPYALLQALRRKASAQGVTYRKAAAVGVRLNGGMAAEVELSDGERVGCGVLVNAAGPRARQVARLAGVDLPVTPVKAHTFAFQAERPAPNCPITLDQALGLNFKPEGRLFVCASPASERLQDAGEDFEVDGALFEETVWPLLARRVPQFDTLRLTRAWVGHIEWCELDGNPIIGLHPERPNLLLANGFSGHGVQHAPAVGRALAELLMHGAYRTLDLSRFAFGRVARGEPLREAA